MEKEKLLYISSNLFPVDSGATIYTYGNILRFSRFFDIDLVSFVQSKNVHNEPYFDRLIEKIHSFHEIRFDSGYLELIMNIIRHKVIFQKYSQIMINKVENLTQATEYPYIVLDGFLVFYLLDEIIKNRDDQKVILIEHNIEFTIFQEQIRYSPTLFQKMKNILLSFGAKKFEVQSWKKSDIVLFISKEDLTLANNVTGRLLSSAVLPPFFPYEPVKSRHDLENPTHNLLILGSMWWYPNVQGAIWFIEQVLFRLRERDEKYKLYIVGNNPSSELLKYSSDAVIITGSVPSVDPYIKMSDFLIVPNYSGGGVKIKIYEGIMKNIPVLARPESLVGYPDGILPDEYVTRDPEAFAKIITEQNENIQKKLDFLRNAQENLKKNENIEGIIQLLKYDTKNT